MTFIAPHILLVEDNPIEARLAQERLAKAADPFVVTHVETMAAAVECLQTTHFDAVLLDLALPDNNGFSFLERIVAADPHLPIVVLTGLDDESLAAEAIRKGAQDYLVKDQMSGRMIHRAIRYARERKRAEEKLQFVNAVLQTQQETSPDGILIVSADSKIISFNQRFVDMWGIPADRLATRRDDLVLQSVLDRLVEPAEFLARVNYLYEHRDEKSYEEVALIGGVTFERHSSPMFGPDGKTYGRIWYFRDITERKRAEQALRESEGRVRKKLDAILLPEGGIEKLEFADVVDTAALQRLMEDFSKIVDCATAILDLHGSVLTAVGWQDICTKFHRIHPVSCKHCLESDVVLSAGVKQGEFKIYRCKNNMWDVAMPIVVGDTHIGNVFLGQFFFDDEAIDYDAFRRQAREYGFNEEEYIAALDRVPRWSRDKVTAATTFCAGLASLVSTLSYSSIKLSRMLNERERAEKELREYRDHLEEIVQQRTAELVSTRDQARAAEAIADAANRAKSVFLATMSHEIRTPMTAILGYADLLMDPMLNPDSRKVYAATIRRSGEHLLGLINDILDLSKIEAGKVTLDIGRCHVAALLGDIASMLRPRAKERGIFFSMEFSGPLPETIATDSARLRQAIINLAGNAIKFTDQGGVRIVASFLPKDAKGQPAIRVDVIDTGIGISEEILPRLFHAFTQGDASVTRKYGGTGLGLTISHHIARLLGGDLTVKSELGHGSAFTLVVPTGNLDGVPILQHPSELTREDHSKNWVSEVTSLTGVRILLAEDGIDNRELIQAILERVGGPGRNGGERPNRR